MPNNLLEMLRAATTEGTVTLSSGKTADYYIDARSVILSAAGLDLARAAMLNLLRGLDCQALAGKGAAVLPLLGAMAADGELDCLVVRETFKMHGPRAGLCTEGPRYKGGTAVIIEDVATTGRSALDVAWRIGEERAVKIIAVVTLVDRQEGAREAIEAHGYEFRAVYTADQVRGREC
jgi:orotate phosphoribosyltransferase